MSRRLLATLAGLLLTLTHSVTATAEDACPRIISQSPYITQSLQWLGLEACIVGVSRYDRLDLPRTGGILDPDIDALELLEPDLIYTSDWSKEETMAAATPEGARSVRLKGFGSMAEVEENLRQIAADTGIGAERAEAFAAQWRSAAAAIDGGGRRVLLVSSCSGNPYAFGQQRWLSDLFSAAGFVNVETVDKLRHIRPGEEVEQLTDLINQLKPELVFIFERTLNPQCAFIRPETPVRIITLDGELFLHPAPVILEGLAELARRQGEWRR